jgi:non-heme chloroperoxidase
MVIREAAALDVETIYEIVNDSARAYKGVIPEAAWHEPYMPMDHLQSEIAKGVRFYCCDLDGRTMGVMGIQDVKDVTLVGFSTGGGEVARYIGRYGTAKVKKAVLVSAVPPLMLKTAANPGGLPIEVFDGIRQGELANRSQLYLDIASGPFFGFNRPGAKVSQGLIQSFWVQGMQAGHKNTYDSIAAFSATDFTEDLKRFNVPTLVIHGDDDQIVPFEVGGKRSAELIDGAELKVYEGSGHALPDTDRERLHADLLEFLNR